MTIDPITLSVFCLFFGIWVLVQNKFIKNRTETNLFLLKMLSKEHEKEVEKLQQEIVKLEEKIRTLQEEEKSTS